jgi:hypothetical protein
VVLLVVPLVPVAVAVAGRLRSYGGPVLGYVALNPAIAVMNVVDVAPFWYVWVPFDFALSYAAARRRVPLPG